MIAAAHKAKANAALDMLVRVNGGEFMTRRALVERRVAAGARVIDRRGVLRAPAGDDRLLAGMQLDELAVGG